MFHCYYCHVNSSICVLFLPRVSNVQTTPGIGATVEQSTRVKISAFAPFTIITKTISFFNKPIDQFVVYNNYNEIEMGYVLNGQKSLLSVDSLQTIAHPSASIVLLTHNLYKSKTSNFAVPVDYLILASDNSFSIAELTAFYQPKKVIVDSSINRYASEKIQNECRKLNVAFHDISNSGAFSVNF